MLIEQPPLLYRLFFPEAIWRLKHRGRKVVYLTFDDGPIPEVTPWALDVLDKEEVKATFFLVGDNVRKHPALFEELKKRGHSYGNHTMHHVQGLKTPTRAYLRDIEEADALIGSSLFRPPHGIMRFAQARALKDHYNIVMYDLITRDYDSSIRPDKILRNVMDYVRNGSIIVFHDSLRSERNLRYALPRAIQWLKKEGYEFLPMRML